MHRDLRRLVRSEHREKHLDGEVGITMACVAGRLENKGLSPLTLPVPRRRLKVETNDPAAGCPINDDNRCCYSQSGAIDHVANSVEMAFHGKEFLRLHVRTGSKVIAR